MIITVSYIIVFNSSCVENTLSSKHLHNFICILILFNVYN
jgi:hypothetical protein